MGPNEQNQHSNKKVCLYIHAFVLLRCLPSLDMKHKLFVTKKRKNCQPSLGLTDYRWFSKYLHPCSLDESRLSIGRIKKLPTKEILVS